MYTERADSIFHSEGLWKCVVVEEGDRTLNLMDFARRNYASTETRESSCNVYYLLRFPKEHQQRYSEDQLLDNTNWETGPSKKPPFT